MDERARAVTVPSDRTSTVLRRNNVTITGRADGPVVMFAHGFGCGQDAWNLVAPRFESDHAVVLFDHVGAGGSEWSAYDRGKYDSLDGYASDVLEIIEALGISEVAFVGHSVSAMVGVLAVNRRPELFRTLVMVSPSPKYVNDGEYVGGFEHTDIAALLDSLDSNYLGWSRKTAPVIMGTPDRPALGDRLTESFCRVDPQIAGHFARVTFTSDNRDDLKSLRIPTLVLQSRDDAIAPPAVGRYVHQAVTGSELVILDTTGHVPILSAPDEVATHIQRFLS